jgi:serine/threonine kinase PknH
VLQSMFGPYRIEELLGRGGMGEVYRAHDTETDREVALKLLPGHLAEDDEYQARFRRECRVAARLSEPHVVPIHRFGEIDGRLYLDMRLVEGTDLGAWLRAHGPMPADAAVAVVGQVAKALDAAHADGLVHRDVKPTNVLLAGVDGPDVDAGSVFAYLFDFGIARARDGAERPDDPALTRVGTMPGSLSYIAPERFSGVEGDPRADVYALACVLYQALTGRPPFDGDMPTLMRAHLQAPPPRPSALRTGLPAALDEVVARGMAKDPEQRYQSAGALGSAARAAIGASTSTGVGVGTATVLSAAAAPPVPGSVLPPGGQPWGAPPAGWSNPSQPQLLAPQPPLQQPPPPRGNGRAAYIAIGVAAATVVVGIAVVLALVLGDDGRTTVTPQAGGQTSTSAPPPTSTTSQAGTATAPATDPAAAANLLLAELPVGFGPANCAAVEDKRIELQAVAYVECATGVEGGPTGATFTRYATQAQMAQAFTDAADAEGIPPEPGTLENCATATSQRLSYNRSGTAEEAGSVACYTESDTGASFLIWTDNDALALGYLRHDTGDAGALYTWWQGNDFQVDR